uniref:5-bromo-4-chloroindolyl phosphate hydrolysis protein n=1 Tax=Candidatus Enterococcus mansonii TaxID=1834181 RepID=A0A242CH16_9ENTE|nr:5-bromo-4-chloroindolyl phosphate hydrolysis family protein [Enterococcus sp. 4G2_DIV0659]OTO09525.1 hypothetical protein A5880_000204 [Enterococcus sp. 4G2_DIV0659]
MKIIGLLVLLVFLKGIEYFRRLYTYKKRIKTYQKNNQLTSDELQLFKETMFIAKKQIIRLELMTSKSTILMKIEKKEKGLHSSKLLFDQLMKHPKEMTELEQFLYTKLPSIVQATEKFIQIQDAELSTTEIKKSKTMIIETISSISASITDEYEEIIQELSLIHI